MISFRYHVVTVVGILFALAAGVVLGNGLGGSGTGSTTSDQSALSAKLDDAQQKLATAESGRSWDEKYISGVANRTVAGSLSGRTVVLVVAPGASADTVAALTGLVSAAGGSLVGRVTLGNNLIDPGSRQLVEQLGSQLAASTKGVTVPAGLSGYERFGYLLARSVVTKAASGAPLDQTASALSAGISAAHLASYSKDLQRRASLVLLVGPAESGSDGAPAATILDAIAGRLAVSAGGVMVLSDSVDGAPAAVVEAIRDDPTNSRSVATEDSGESTAGRVVAVLGLAAAARGTVGHYGAGSLGDRGHSLRRGATRAATIHRLGVDLASLEPRGEVRLQTNHSPAARFASSHLFPTTDPRESLWPVSSLRSMCSSPAASPPRWAKV